MSTVNNINTPELNNITIPPLDSVEFGSGLSDVFANINQNFIRLAHRDFVKGESGDAVKIIPMSIVDENGEFNELGQKIQECISGLSTLQDKADQANVIDNSGNIITIWDSIKNNSGSIYMIYNVPNDVSINNLTPVGSLPYVFLDGRFATNNIGRTISQDEYDNLTDFSCLLVYENGRFNALSNAFPTIYFDGTLGLCWKINGHNTGIPVQGMPGKNGENATMYMVRCNADNESNNAYVKKHKITHIHTMSDGYVDVATYANDFDINDLNSVGAIILGYGDADNNNEFFFGVISVENNELYANFANANSITVGFQSNEFLNSMKNIDIMNNGTDGSIGIKGLFVPITTVRNSVLDNNGNPIQPVHLFTATSIVNEEGQERINENHDAILTPVNNINTIDLSGDNELKVEKYLYLVLNKDHNEIVNCLTGTNDTNLSKYNYILKYKLTSRVLKVQTEELPICNVDIADTGNSYAYYKYDSLNNETPETTTDVLETIPTNFRTRIDDEKGLYKWELNQIHEEFDPELLKEGLIDGATLYYSELSGLNLIQNIYTDTINPALDTEVLWFNGIETLDTVSIPDEEEPNTNKTEIILYGYYNGNEDERIFSFYKFTPVFNNSFKVDNDNALNINYNINVTGEEHATRNITINGGVNCENLKVYELTASGEIKDIYTNDVIVGNKGIKLAHVTDENNGGLDYNFVVDNDGKLLANGGIQSTSLNCSNNQESIPNNTIASNNIITDDIDTNEIKVNDYNNERKIFIGNVSNSKTTYKLGVEVKDACTIDLTRRAVDSKKPYDLSSISTITNDIPVIQSNNSGVIVSNTSKNSGNLFFVGAPTKYEGKSYTIPSGVVMTTMYDPGEGVTGNSNIDKNNFDAAKNFNIHRLSLSSDIKSLLQVNNNVDGASLTMEDAEKDIFAYNPGSDDDIQYTDNPNSNIDNIKKNTMQCFTFSNNDTNKQTFNKNKPIEISFNKNFICQIGIKGECTYGKWPILYKTSYMKLRLYYRFNNDNSTIGYYETKTFDIGYSTGNTNNDNGYEWVGYDKEGKSLSDNYKNRWRYYSYGFIPDKIVINPVTDDTNIFNKIATAYDAGQKIELYLYPVFHLRAKGQKDKDVVSGLSVTRILPTSKSVQISSGTLSKQSAYYKPSESAITNSGSILSYTINSEADDENASNNTTICENGIVMRSGKYVFGLGYGKSFDHSTQEYNVEDKANNPSWKESDDSTINKYVNAPVLFYYEHDENYYSSKDNPKTDKTLEGYAKRVHSIPLKDLFDVIRYIRTTTDFSTWLSNPDK